MRTWLQEHWDWLLAGIFISLATSTTIGLKDRTKGGALFAANCSASIMALVLYPFLAKYGYSGEWVLLLGLFCGACGTAMFGVLTSLSTVIDRRRERLAEGIVNRVAPEDKSP